MVHLYQHRLALLARRAGPNTYSASPGWPGDLYPVAHVAASKHLRLEGRDDTADADHAIYHAVHHLLLRPQLPGWPCPLLDNHLGL